MGPKTQRRKHGGFLSETAIQRQCIDYLKANNYFYWRSNNIAVQGRSFSGRRGVPDLLVVLPPHGRLLGIEVKSEKGRMSEHQKEFKSNLDRLGAVYAMVQSLDDLINVFERSIV